jgi:PEP-CTERM motif
MRVHRKFLFALLAVAMTAFVSPPPLHAAVVVDDSFTDGGRNDGADPLDTNWWTSSASSGIEIAPGSLGMVTGGTGRGIHAIFPTQQLANIGDSLKATYTFTTPATVGSGGSGAFRVGLFDTLGRAGLNADVSASTAAPNAVYGLYSAGTTGLPGYMLDMDVGTGTEDLSFRQLDTAINTTAQTPTGRLMGTTAGFTTIGTGPDGSYAFAANTQYTGSLTVTRLNATDYTITGTLTTPAGTTTHSVTDTFDSDSFGMLAFWANSSIFGSSSTPNTADNGIDFSNVKIEYTSVPEPASLSLLVIGFGWVGTRRRRRRAA